MSPGASASEMTFVTGGARSGKSRYAEGLAAAAGTPVLYVATAEARDGEMARRVAEHRRRRPPEWRTLEARRGVAAALGEYAPAGLAGSVVLLDCLSLLVSNILLDLSAERGEGEGLEAAAGRAVAAELRALIEWHSGSGARLILVSNEVGWGVVPPHRLGRIYRDLLGSANQRLAACATEAYLLVAGLPLRLKGGDESAGPPP